MVLFDFKVTKKNQHVFCNSNAVNDEMKGVLSLLQSEEGKKELKFYDMTFEDIGLHSIRKGVSTFVTHSVWLENNLPEIPSIV